MKFREILAELYHPLQADCRLSSGVRATESSAKCSTITNRNWDKIAYADRAPSLPPSLLLHLQACLSRLWRYRGNCALLLYLPRLPISQTHSILSTAVRDGGRAFEIVYFTSGSMFIWEAGALRRTGMVVCVFVQFAWLAGFDLGRSLAQITL